ncbi:Hypothetical predicted protein, partial [Pelobates cultripes]
GTTGKAKPDSSHQADLLHEMRHLHAADLEMLTTEITVVTACTQASEEDILDLKQEVQSLREAFQQIQSSHTSLTISADLAEDRHRCTNLKI